MPPGSPATPSSAHAQGLALPPGTTLGRYVISKPLGAGGMGVVYAAYDPELDRKMALKLLRPELGSDAPNRTRLLREAQAMARLQHPNVVAVHDVGTFGDQVFVAMEFIAGMALDEWLASEKRPWREVVHVLVQAGKGLAAAHLVGLVHRDFKPGNVMIGDDHRVRVMDFGLARTTTDPEHDPETQRIKTPPAKSAASVGPLGRDPTHPLLTHPGDVVGTPAYMAPEQLLGRSTDARSDQFSFGVTLYEALFGERPWRGEHQDDLAREMSEKKQPTPPAGSGVPAYIRKVVLRALALQPTHRYPSMEALTDELEQRPRRARARRLGILAAIGVVGLGALTVGLAQRRESLLCRGAERKLAGTWDPQRREEVHRAFVATGVPYAEDAFRRVVHALDAYGVRWAEAHTEACEATQLRGEQSQDALDLRIQCLEGDLGEVRSLTRLFAAADPKVVERAVAAVSALQDVRACADVRRLRSGLPIPPGRKDAVAGVRARLSEAKANFDAGRYPEALAIARPALEDARRAGYRPAEAETLLRIGKVLDARGEPKEAVKSLRDAYLAGAASGHDEIAARAATDLVKVAGFQLGSSADGRFWADLARASLDRMGGNDPVDAELQLQRGTLAWWEGHYDEALGHVETALSRFQRLHGPSHIDVARASNNLGIVRFAQGKLPEALAAYRFAHEVRERTHGPDHPEVAAALSNLANAERLVEEYDSAIRHLQRAIEIRERALGPQSPFVADSLGQLSGILWSKGQFEEALAKSRRALGILERAFGPDKPQVAAVHTNLAIILGYLKRYDEARTEVERAIQIRRRVFGGSHPLLALSLDNLGWVLWRQNKFAEARERFEDALAIFTANKDSTSTELADTLLGLGETLIDLGKFADARQRLERALAIGESKMSKRDVARVRCALARALAGSGGDLALARKVVTEALSVFERYGPAGADDAERAKKWLKKEAH